MLKMELGSQLSQLTQLSIYNPFKTKVSTYTLFGQNTVCTVLGVTLLMRKSERLLMLGNVVETMFNGYSRELTQILNILVHLRHKFQLKIKQ